MGEILETRTEPGPDGAPQLRIKLNHFRPFYSARVVALFTLVGLEIVFFFLALAFKNKGEGSNRETSRSFSSKGISMDLEIEKNEGKPFFKLIVRVKGTVPEGKKYSVRVRDSRGDMDHVDNIDKEKTILDNGCRLWAHIKKVPGKYVATIEDYENGAIVVQKEFSCP